MKFDFVIGNPPYQEESETESTTNGQKPRKNIFQHFQLQADELSVESSVLIYPGGRWMHQSGKGLKQFGKDLINDRRLATVEFYPDSKEVFGQAADLFDGITIVTKKQGKKSNGFEYVYNRNGNRTQVYVENPGDDLIQLNPNDLEVSKKIKAFVTKKNIKFLHDAILPRSLFGIESDFAEKNPDKVRVLKDGETIDYSSEIKLFTNDKAGKAGRAKWFVVKKDTIINNVSYVSEYQVVVSSANAGGQKRDNIISAIVNNYKETADGYVSFLKANIDLLIQVFSESEHENLRTFKSFIIDFERIYKVWKDSDIPADEMSKVLYAFGAFYFESRANNIKKEANVYCFEEKNTADKYSKLSYAYLLSQFEAWIVDGIWDEQSLIDALRVRFSIKNVKDYELFLNCDFWSLNDDIIAKGLPEALALAYEGCLCADDLISLLGRIHSLNNYDVALPCAIDYKRVQDGLKKREESIKNGSIVEPNKRTFLVPDEVVNMCEEARTLYRDIQVFDNRVIALKRRFDFLNYLRCSDSIDIYKLREQRFISFDNELLEFFITSFKTADNRKKKELYYALKSLIFDNTDLSNNDDILDTVNNLNELVKILTRMLDEEKSSFTGCVIKEIIKDLNERIKKIDVSNKSGS